MVIVYPVSEPMDATKARFAQIAHTAHALARHGCEVHLLIGRSGNASAVLAPWELSVVPSLRIRALPLLRRAGWPVSVSWNAVYHVSCLFAVLRLARCTRLHALYVRHLKLAAFLLRFRALVGRPIVYEAHELFFLTANRKERAARLRALEERVFRGVDGIVAITASLKRIIQEQFRPLAPMFVIPDGVALDRFHPEEWKGGRTICYVGQLYPWKGVEVLVRAMRYLERETALVVGGTPDSIESVRALAAAEGCAERLRFTGQVAPLRVREFLKGAGVAVLPGTRTWLSEFFTSPLKLFEYMAAGVPIVAADLPSVREVLTHDETAVLVAPEDPRALADGIGRVLRDRDLALRLRARALEAVERYSWDERARRLMGALETILGRGRR